MSFIDGLFQQETLPMLEASMGFAHQKHLTILNNIANVETPEYKRQDVPTGEFQRALGDAIQRRSENHPMRFDIKDQFDVVFRNNHYPMVRRQRGMEAGPERHDENSVVIEKEMVDLAKNTMMIQSMQRLYKKKLTMMRSALRDRV